MNYLFDFASFLFGSPPLATDKYFGNSCIIHSEQTTNPNERNPTPMNSSFFDGMSFSEEEEEQQQQKYQKPEQIDEIPETSLFADSDDDDDEEEEEEKSQMKLPTSTTDKLSFDSVEDDDDEIIEEVDEEKLFSEDNVTEIGDYDLGDSFIDNETKDEVPSSKEETNNNNEEEEDEEDEEFENIPPTEENHSEQPSEDEKEPNPEKEEVEEVEEEEEEEEEEPQEISFMKDLRDKQKYKKDIESIAKFLQQFEDTLIRTEIPVQTKGIDGEPTKVSFFHFFDKKKDDKPPTRLKKFSKITTKKNFCTILVCVPFSDKGTNSLFLSISALNVQPIANNHDSGGNFSGIAYRSLPEKQFYIPSFSFFKTELSPQILTFKGNKELINVTEKCYEQFGESYFYSEKNAYVDRALRNYENDKNAPIVLPPFIQKHITDSWYLGVMGKLKTKYGALPQSSLAKPRKRIVSKKASNNFVENCKSFVERMKNLSISKDSKKSSSSSKKESEKTTTEKSKKTKSPSPVWRKKTTGDKKVKKTPSLELELEEVPKKNKKTSSITNTSKPKTNDMSDKKSLKKNKSESILKKRNKEENTEQKKLKSSKKRKLDLVRSFVEIIDRLGDPTTGNVDVSEIKSLNDEPFEKDNIINIMKHLRIEKRQEQILVGFCCFALKLLATKFSEVYTVMVERIEKCKFPKKEQITTMQYILYLVSSDKFSNDKLEENNQYFIDNFSSIKISKFDELCKRFFVAVSFMIHNLIGAPVHVDMGMDDLSSQDVLDIFGGDDSESD